MNLPTGNSTSISLRLCCDALEHAERAAVLVAPLAGSRSCAPGEELAGHRLAVARDLRRRPFGDDLAAVQPGARPHVDEPVGAPHHLLVVLDDDDRVADVAQPLERRDQPRVVALVQADRRLVEDVEHADELRADLRREPQALRLAARQRRRRAVERQVADADVVEERQPLADLLDDPMPDQLLGLRQAELVEEPRARAFTDICVNSWIDLPPTVTASTSGFRRAPLQTGHGRSDMYSSIRSRCCDESVSR